MTQENMDVYVTSEGREVKLRPVSDVWLVQAQLALEKEYREQGDPIEPPTYDIETVSGAMETWPLTEDSLEADTEEETDERKKTWYAHQEALTRMNTELAERETAVWLVRGVVGEEPTEEWEAFTRWAGIEIPENPLDRSYLYLTTELFPSRSDLAGVLMRLRMISLGDIFIDEGLIQATEASFRDSVREKGREALAEFGDRIRSLVAQPEVPASEGEIPLPTDASEVEGTE